jgi:hypothetical protein
LNGYEIIGRIGVGAQGIVFLAHAGDTGERRAVKLLHADLAEDADVRARFLREAQVARQVARFCTAQIVDVGLDDDRPYVVSEYVDGPSLRRLVIDEGPLSGAQLERLAIGMATALVAIHRAGIVHRDFKPANVLLGPDGPRVIDFGVSRALDVSSTLSGGRAVGTPAYMSPEQLNGRDADPAMDVFAFAATLVYAATGSPPFGQDSIPAVMSRILTGDPQLGGLSGPLHDLAADCLAKEPVRRPNARELLLRLLGHDAAHAANAPGEALVMLAEAEGPESAAGSVAASATASATASAADSVAASATASRLAQQTASSHAASTGPETAAATTSARSVSAQPASAQPASARPASGGRASARSAASGNVTGGGAPSRTVGTGRSVRRAGIAAAAALATAGCVIGAFWLVANGDRGAAGTREGGEAPGAPLGSVVTSVPATTSPARSTTASAVANAAPTTRRPPERPPGRPTSKKPTSPTPPVTAGILWTERGGVTISKDMPTYALHVWTEGGPVHWTATTSGPISAPASGYLPADGRTDVTITKSADAPDQGCGYMTISGERNSRNFTLCWE